MRRFIFDGGSVFVMASEGGETKVDTNVNFLLEEYGIMVNSGATTVELFY